MRIGLKTFVLPVVFALFFRQSLFAQSTVNHNYGVSGQNGTSTFSGNHPGAPSGASTPKHPAARSGRNFPSPKNASGLTYSAYLYTFNDVAIFSYFDSTIITLTDYAGKTITDTSLNTNAFYTLSPGNGIFSVSGNKPFSVLTSDIITNPGIGYFALDENGYGTGTKFNTWMMGGEAVDDPHFIIFAYDSGTSFTVRDLVSGDSLLGGVVDSTGYFDFPNVSSIQDKALQVVSNNPVSVLSYTDQGYYVPSSSGAFAGNLFYGFSGYEPGIQNSITLVSYSDSNVVVLTSLTNNDTLAVDTLNHWQVKSFPVNSDMFWKIKSEGTLTAANIPFEESWEDYNSSYWYLDEVADSTGKNIGRSFIVPTTQSDLSIFSYDDNNSLQIIKLGGTAYPYESPVLVKDTVLGTGDVYVYTTEVGDYVYRIQSSGRVSIVQSSNGAGASFITVNGSTVTNVTTNKTQPVNFMLYQNYPNPFNPTTTISYSLPVSGHVTLEVYDILGREVKTLVNVDESAGYHTAMFNASRLSSGVYFYRLIAPGISQVKKMVVMK